MISDEKLALRNMIKLVSEGKTIIIMPDLGQPYTLSIIDKNGNEKHTHNSYVWDEADQQAIHHAVESLVNHLLGRGGLSFVEEKAGE